MTTVIDELKQELQRRQGMVDMAFEQLDCATRELEEIRAQIVELLQLAGAGDVPTLDNRRGPKGKPITWQGKTLSIWQWSQLTGIRANTIYLRLKRGWSTERALTEKEHEKAQPETEDATLPVATVARPLPENPIVVAKSAPSGFAAVVPPAVAAAVEALPAPISVPPPDAKAKLSAASEVVVSPESKSDSDFDEDPEPRAAEKSPDLDALKAKVRALQGGNKQKPVGLVTTRVSNHAHTAKVDFFGDGQTDVDGSGHVHPVRQFVTGKAHGHFHDFILPG